MADIRQLLGCERKSAAISLQNDEAGYDATVSQVQTHLGNVLCLRQLHWQLGQPENNSTAQIVVANNSIPIKPSLAVDRLGNAFDETVAALTEVATITKREDLRSWAWRFLNVLNPNFRKDNPQIATAMEQEEQLAAFRLRVQTEEVAVSEMLERLKQFPKAASVVAEALVNRGSDAREALPALGEAMSLLAPLPDTSGADRIAAIRAREQVANAMHKIAPDLPKPLFTETSVRSIMGILTDPAVRADVNRRAAISAARKAAEWPSQGPYDASPDQVRRLLGALKEADGGIYDAVTARVKEIGSEGRNFQFAHHLVLFDLPLNPELLEQRIGRLDRIGQTKDIQIHVPYIAHSPQEVLARWYHEALNAFECNLEGANELLHQFGRPVHDLALEFSVADRAAADQELAELLPNTTVTRREIRRLLEQGRDRLLELNSFRPGVAQKIISQIHEQERQPDLENYLLDVFDHFGVHIEELAPHTWQLNPQGIITDSFPSMPAEGMVATCDRRRALSREDVGFLTWDHPLVTGAMDLLLGAETGNCAFAVLPAANERTMLFELVFVLETIAAPRLHADRFLSPTPIRLVVNHKLEDVTEAFCGTTWSAKLQKGSPYKLIENAEIARRTFPAMFQTAATLAETKATALHQSALKEMNVLLDHEVERLQTLAQVNDHVRPQEIRLAQAQQEELATTLQQSRLRLDCLRLIWKGPPEALT